MAEIFELSCNVPFEQAIRGVEERPEACTSPCWRNGGDYACTCDDYDRDGTTEGGW